MSITIYFVAHSNAFSEIASINVWTFYIYTVANIAQHEFPRYD